MIFKSKQQLSSPSFVMEVQHPLCQLSAGLPTLSLLVRSLVPLQCRAVMMLNIGKLAVRVLRARGQMVPASSNIFSLA